MKSFRLVPASEGPRREFKIALGLRAGYGSAGRIYDLEEAVRTAHRWMSAPHEASRFYPGCLPAARSSMPLLEVKPRAIASRLPFSQVRFSRNTPAILMMAPSGSFSMNWLERWAAPSNRRRCISPIAIEPGH